MNIKDLITSDKPYTNYYSEEYPKLQAKAKELCFKYNQTFDEDIKKEILKDLLGDYNPSVFINQTFHCDYGFNIHFKGRAIINYNCVILDTSPVNIGKNIFIGPNVTIACSGHSLDPIKREKGLGTSAPITIGDNVWVGANVTIGGGVSIGDNTTIGAGSVVTKDIPSNVLAYGVPCKVIRQIDKADTINKEDIVK